VNVTVICNPHSGRGSNDGRLEPALAVLNNAGWSPTVHYTAGPRDATRVARLAVERGDEIVLAAGGDGTLNEAAQALAATGVALGYLPFGTVNIWARELGMPLQPIEAARTIVEGRIEAVDLGMANDRYFLLMTGVGFDGEVVRRTRRFEHHKQRFSILPYVAGGLVTVASYRGTDVELRYDGLIRRVQALMLVVGNTRLYAGRFRFTPHAVANDGWLDLCIARGRGPLALARQSLPLFLSGSITHSDVELLRVRELSVQTDEPIPFQVDGELAGTTPIYFRIVPLALKVIVPKDFSSDLLL
jgi:YegS/Rv2252/BmrU family lipid kinase